MLSGGDVAAQGAGGRASIDELKKLSVEQLTNVEVTLVSRSEERLGGAPAAVTVVTGEDIRRSGATTIPEALRLVPGVHVARQTSNIWAVSSRGFSNTNSEKLLVLSDTRSIYTPLFSGVQWDVQSYALQDIDRIEVVRGPGATLWGSNAVNGVINITTKSARDTQGLYAETVAGTAERVAATARYGGRIGSRAFYRVYGSYADRDSGLTTPIGRSDDWRLGQIGGRTDWETVGGDSFTIQGDAYHGNVGRLSPSATITGRPGPIGDLRVKVGGGNILGRYRRNRSDGSEIQLRVYYDRTHRDDPSFVDDLHTVDADFQQRFGVGGRQQITWGVNDRFTTNENRGKVIFNLEPPTSRDNLLGGFVQNELTIRNGLRLTGGTKIEHNDFSGLEVQPGARIAWDVAAPHMLWAAVSRGVRVPTRLERDVAIDVTDPRGSPVVRLLGNDEFESEQLLAFEVGYRSQQWRQLVIDVAAFHNQYSGLASLELESPFSDPEIGRTVIPIRNRNLTDGFSRGAELLATVSPRENWRLMATYSYIDISLDIHGQDQNRGRHLEDATPRHQFGVRSFLDLAASIQLDAQLRSVGTIRRLPVIVTGEGIAGYTELDVRISWRGWRDVELSFVGQNLLHDRHPEFGAPASRGDAQRGAYGKIAWGF